METRVGTIEGGKSFFLPRLDFRAAARRPHGMTTATGLGPQGNASLLCGRPRPAALGQSGTLLCLLPPPLPFVLEVREVPVGQQGADRSKTWALETPEGYTGADHRLNSST